MADLCKQCSVEIFGVDFEDLAGVGGFGPTLLPEYGYPVICEGCGFILVNDYGECISTLCLKRHGRTNYVDR